MVLSFDGVTLLTQSKSLWCHLARPIHKSGHSGAGKTLHLPVVATQLGALGGAASLGAPGHTPIWRSKC